MQDPGLEPSGLCSISRMRSDDVIDIEITLLDQGALDDLERMVLNEAEPRIISSKGFSGSADVVVLVAGSAWLAIRTFEWLRARWRQDIVVDLRKGRVRIVELDRRSGYTVIVAPDGSVTEHPPQAVAPAISDLARILSPIDVPPKP